MSKFGQKANKKVEELVELLPEKGNVLDLGCGGGGNSIFLTENGFNVTCIDTDKEVNEGFKKNYPDINVINQNILDFEFKENKYDMVLAINVLNFFKGEDVYLIINNIIKSLNNNGLTYIQVFSINDPSYNKFLEIAEKTGNENTFYSKKTQSFTHFFTQEELLNYFSKNRILECEETTIKDNHPPKGEHEHSIIKALIKK